MFNRYFLEKQEETLHRNNTEGILFKNKNC